VSGNPEDSRLGDDPLLDASTLPHGAPRFNRIASGDFRGAFDRGMVEELAEVERIATDPEPPTFANTLEALERSGQRLRHASRIFTVLLSTTSDATLEAIDAEYASKLAAHRDAIALDPRLFARVRSIHDRRASLELEPEQRRLVERIYTGFTRSGALLDDADKAALRLINTELSDLVSTYRRRLLNGTNAAALVVDDASTLEGLTAEDLAAAAAAAKSRGLDGRWVLPLQNTTQQPALASLRRRAMRERLFHASISRNAGGEHDTTALVTRMAQLRAERARLLGFPTHAALVLDDEAASTPGNALALMKRLVAPATARTREEARRLEARMREDNDREAVLEPWDWPFYAEQVRKTDFDIDEAEVRQFFELERVVRDGVFFAATSLYGITFRERPDLPVYHPDVRAFEVLESDGRSIGLVYFDLFARPSKRGGAWMNALSVQSHLLGTTPVVTNVANLAKPSPGNPALLTTAEVNMLFHEFGHALHGLFSNVRYATLAGTAVPRDFVELPSQFNEHWATEPQVFARYARHYRTGEPMPAALKQRIDRARLFNAGYAISEVLAAVFLDFEWHQLAAGDVPADVAAFEAAALASHGLADREVPPRYRTPYFAHIWMLGYAAGYYSYLWSAVLDNDAYYWFREHGGMTRANGQRFRDCVLSRGRTGEAAELYRQFRGRDASIEPLLAERGLTSPNGDLAPPKPD
jgi:peptidyl-dipeptidase Dcp